MRSALPSHSLELWSAWFKSVLVLALRKGKTKLGLFLTRARELDRETTVSPCAVIVLSCLGTAQEGILGPCNAVKIAAGSYQIQMPPEGRDVSLTSDEVRASQDSRDTL